MVAEGTYDEEPVKVCMRCGSLFVLGCAGVDYCGKCGSTELEEMGIGQWLEEKEGGRWKEGDDEEEW